MTISLGRRQSPRRDSPPVGLASLAFVMWRLSVDATTASISHELNSRRVPCILLKGPLLTKFLYDDPNDRPYSDSDLLVRHSDLATAEQILRGLGFVRVDRDEDHLGPEPKYAHTFQRFSDNAVVDLHWNLSGATSTPDTVWSALASQAEELQVGGKTVTGLNAAGAAVLVALHNAHHGDTLERTLIDLDRAAIRFELSTWHEAAVIADALGAASSFAAGLRLTYAGECIADRLGVADPASVEMWLKTNPSTYGAWALACIMRTPSLKARARVAARVLFPPRVIMHSSFPMSRRGRTALLVAYAVRPVRLLVHAGPALRDWTRARRSVKALPGG